MGGRHLHGLLAAGNGDGLHPAAPCCVVVPAPAAPDARSQLTLLSGARVCVVV